MEVYRPVPILVKFFVDPPKVLLRPKWRHPHSNLVSLLVPFQEKKFHFLKEFYGEHVAEMFSSGMAVWTVCRPRGRELNSHSFFRNVEIDTPLTDPMTGEELQKSVFIIFYQGDQLRTRVKKICESLKVNTLMSMGTKPIFRHQSTHVQRIHKNVAKSQWVL